jgi:hypothetical protein
MSIDWNLLSTPRCVSNRGRFLVTRLAGLGVLLWLYSLQAQDKAVEPDKVAEPVPQAVEPVSQKISIPPNVKDFGAVADGVADDSAAIQRAVDASLRPLHFPAGTYRVTRTIEIRLDKTGFLSITGDGLARILVDTAGPAFRIVGTHQGTADPKTVTAPVWDRQRAPMIDGIEIVGRKNETSGIELQGTMQATISRVSIRNVLHGIVLTHRNRNVQISECHLYDNRGVGVLMDGVNLHQINIANSHISYNRQGGIVCRDSEIRNLQITGCDIEGNMGEGLLAANILLDCRRGSVREGAITGCTIQHERDSLGSANIRMLGPTKENSLMVGTFTIGNNVLSDVKTNIHLKSARGVVITGNTLWEGFDYNILAENCSHLVLGHNLLDRNPDQREETSKNGVELRDCVDCSVNGLHLHDVHTTEAPLKLERCSWCNITNCHITDSGETLIDLVKCDNCRVSGCLFRVFKQSITSKHVRVTGGSNNLISDDKR